MGWCPELERILVLELAGQVNLTVTLNKAITKTTFFRGLDKGHRSLSGNELSHRMGSFWQGGDQDHTREREVIQERQLFLPAWLTRH